MRLYGLALYAVAEIIEWYSAREEAEEAVRAVVADEPDFAGVVGVEEVEIPLAQS